MWGWIVGSVSTLGLVIATSVGWMIQPWAPWWFAGGDVATLPLGNPPPVSGNASPPVVHAGGVTDMQRYGLARGAGFNAQDAITAAAISIAEDGSGDPAIMSPRNRDGSFDLGLWQINSGWWQQFGGQAALTNPVVNALAAFTIYGRQGFCAWSTYEARCGPGHTSSYAAFMARARAAANAWQP
jgi:hypothetical protein